MTCHVTKTHFPVQMLSTVKPFFKHSNRYRNKTAETVVQDEIFKKLDELAEDVKEDFKKLGTIAFKGIKEGRLTFESD